MEKFTNRFVPETSFQGSSNAIMMQGAAEVGDGARVWDTMHHNSEAWNPRSSWTHLKDRSEAEQLAFKKYIPTILAIDKTISRRLKDISLVITTLSTSLHDTMVEGMNKGFKTASESLKDLQGDHKSLIRAFVSIVESVESDIPGEMKKAALIVIGVLIILQAGVGFWQSRTIQLQIGSMETVVRDMTQKMEEMKQLMKETEAKEAKMKKTSRRHDPRKKTGGEQFRCSHRPSCGADNESCHRRRQIPTFTEAPEQPYRQEGPHCRPDANRTKIYG